VQRFEAEGVPACLDGLHDLLDRMWAEFGDVPEDQRARFATGLGELVGNLVAHGRTAEGAPVHLVLEVEAREDALEARLADDGVPVPYSEAAMEDLGAESGRGLLLARAVFDELAYRREAGGNVWHVALRRS
jgi:anti-sigma regulatory factor (Ser/Thr protein kinase)